MTKKLVPLTEISEFSPEQKILLLKIHASIESLFTPYRFGRNESGLATVGESKTCAEIFSRRNSFFAKAGILISSGGENSADRKSLGRVLESLLVSGWLRTSGRSTRRGIRVQFSEFGDIRLRESVGLPQLFEASTWRLFRRIYSLQQSGMVREDAAGQFDFETLTDSDPLERLQWRCSPLLVGGLLDSHSDCSGVLGYCLTESGEQIVMRSKPRRPSWLGCFDDVYDRRLADQHHDAFMEAIRERNGWSSTACCVPLGAGSWE